MALCNNGANFLIIDSSKGFIHNFNLNGNLISSINPDNCLRLPWGICVGRKENGDEEIYISDWKAQTVFLFNRDFKFVKKIGENIKNVQCLTIDYASDILYCSHFDDGLVTLWNVNDGTLKEEIRIAQPGHVKIADDKIYILSYADVKRNWHKRKVIKIRKGNCINVINKSTLKIVHKIQFDDWFNPASLHLSRDSNIYSAAYEMDKKGIFSQSMVLFKIDSTNYEIKQKIELSDVRFFDEALHANNKLILSTVNGRSHEIRIIEFKESSSVL